MALQITITGNELTDYLRVDPGNDATTINMLLGSAKDEALKFLNTDFSKVTTIVDNVDGTITTTVEDKLLNTTTVTTTNGSNNGTITITTTDQESPTQVKLWVFNRVAELYENRGVKIAPNFEVIQPLRVYPFKGV
jgi:hypothetical protein